MHSRSPPGGQELLVSVCVWGGGGGRVGVGGWDTVVSYAHLWTKTRSREKYTAP